MNESHSNLGTIYWYLRICDTAMEGDSGHMLEGRCLCTNLWDKKSGVTKGELV